MSVEVCEFLGTPGRLRLSGGLVVCPSLFPFSRISIPYIEGNVAQSVGMEGYFCWKVLKRAYILNIEDNVCGDAGGKRKSAKF